MTTGRPPKKPSSNSTEPVDFSAGKPGGNNLVEQNPRERKAVSCDAKTGPVLSVLITIVSGKESLRRCLTALCTQARELDVEIVVPYDAFSAEVIELQETFPGVRFFKIDDLGYAARADVPSHQHRLYDRRRACGLAVVRGRIVAMTEDHAVPADDWCRQMLTVHEQPYAVIGGPIENAVDRPLHWAWYYCDFGRYGRPIEAGLADYVSDVNIAYKRSALESVHAVWQDAYHETNVHWALRRRGETIFLDPRPVVFQHRLATTYLKAMGERREWGRIFAETRIREGGRLRGLLYAAGTPILPFLLTLRLVRHMFRQGRRLGQMTTALPLAVGLLIGWSWGELVGYLSPLPDESHSGSADSTACERSCTMDARAGET